MKKIYIVYFNPWMEETCDYSHKTGTIYYEADEKIQGFYTSKKAATKIVKHFCKDEFHHARIKEVKTLSEKDLSEMTYKKLENKM